MITTVGTLIDELEKCNRNANITIQADIKASSSVDSSTGGVNITSHFPVRLECKVGAIKVRPGAYGLAGDVELICD